MSRKSTVPPKAWLALENGSVYEGLSAGAGGTAQGEVVFTTSMTGYVETLTDPSYWGQIVVATNPHIGNHGVQLEDRQWDRIAAAGYVVADKTSPDSPGMDGRSLRRFLQEGGVVAASGLPTRDLALMIRGAGALRGVLTTEKASSKALVALARRVPAMEGRSLSRLVSVREPRVFGRSRRRVSLLDLGSKRALIDTLIESGVSVKAFPARTSAATLLKEGPEAVVLSSGPGDPAAMRPEIETTRELMRSGVPVLGICLGYQLLGLAAGASSFKLKFGHHGANHPVKDLQTGQVLITTQNHGFALKAGSLPSGWRETHRSLNDGTLEGFKHRHAAGLQFHPEGAPGPREARELVRRFLNRSS
jgi:carbamoyl-phosphate synthase small subunit